MRERVFSRCTGTVQSLQVPAMAQAAEFSVEDFPTLALFEHGMLVEYYSGGRDAASLAAAVTTRAGKPQMMVEFAGRCAPAAPNTLN